MSDQPQERQALVSELARTGECRNVGEGFVAFDEQHDEVAELTPPPAYPNGWTQRQWALHYREHAKALHGRIVQLQMEACIRSKAERIEEGPIFPNIDLKPFNPKAREAERQREKDERRFSLRRLYFMIGDEVLRKRLIRLERAQDLTVLRFHEAEHRAEHHEFADLEARTIPWAASASMVAVVATLLGACIGRVAGGFAVAHALLVDGGMQVGAVAGAAIGLVMAIQVRDAAEHARNRQIGEARELLTEGDRIYQSVLDEPETFSSWEEFSGEANDA